MALPVVTCWYPSSRRASLEGPRWPHSCTLAGATGGPLGLWNRTPTHGIAQKAVWGQSDFFHGNLELLEWGSNIMSDRWKHSHMKAQPSVPEHQFYHILSLVMQLTKCSPVWKGKEWELTSSWKEYLRICGHVYLTIETNSWVINARGQFRLKFLIIYYHLALDKHLSVYSEGLFLQSFITLCPRVLSGHRVFLSPDEDQAGRPGA